MNYNTVAFLDNNSFNRLESAVEDLNNEEPLSLIINTKDKNYFISDSANLQFSRQAVNHKYHQEILLTDHNELKQWWA